MSRKVTIACVGTGFFSRFHYRAWQRIEAARVVALCTLNRESGEEFAREFGIPAIYTEVDALLAEVRPDLLDIITPPGTHLEIIRTAARHGVDVICQKPFCQSLTEAREAVRICEAAGIRIVVHENFRFQPWYPVLKGRLDSGDLGQVYQATFRLRPGDGQGPRAYLDRQPYFQKMPRLLVHETAIHLIDVFRYLFGDVASVMAALRRLNPAIAGEDSGLFILDTQGGVRCIFDGNRLSDHPAQNRRLTMGEMLIEGEKGTLLLDGDAGIRFRPHGDNAWKDVTYQWENTDFGGDCVMALQQHIIAARTTGAAIQNTGREYLANIEVEEAIYAADASGSRIVLP